MSLFMGKGLGGDIFEFSKMFPAAVSHKPTTVEFRVFPCHISCQQRQHRTTTPKPLLLSGQVYCMVSLTATLKIMTLKNQE